MKKFKIKLVKSLCGSTQTQKDTARCLGLRKTQSESIVPDNLANRGQIRKIQHLLTVEPIKS